MRKISKYDGPRKRWIDCRVAVLMHRDRYRLYHLLITLEAVTYFGLTDHSLLASHKDDFFADLKFVTTYEGLVEGEVAPVSSASD